MDDASAPEDPADATPVAAGPPVTPLVPGQATVRPPAAQGWDDPDDDDDGGDHDGPGPFLDDHRRDLRGSLEDDVPDP